MEQAGGGFEAIWRAYDEHPAEEYPGTVPIALWTSEPNILIKADEEIRNVEHLAGKRIRVSGARPARLIEALGAPHRCRCRERRWTQRSRPG